LARTIAVPPPEPDDSANRLAADLRSLSPREREILCLIASGRNDREIADDLGIAVRTVTTLVTRVLQKLTSAGWNRTSAAAYAVEHGLCEPDLPQPTLPPLSERERQVLCLIAEGLTNRGIAEQMGLKAITINTFVASIFGKLGVDNRAAAAAYTRQHRLCDNQR
jgi:DNA-binding NarL/FixJ family response regulator